MLGLFVMAVSSVIAVFVRLRLRSYVMRSGQGTIGPDDWTDWHLTREHGDERRDSRSIVLARWFLFWKIAGVVGFLLLLCGI
jgi:hypothetical protein